ncbi:hypothetical protein H072_6766 [Dactylellina haptotyla CBS 200.50]|uniref:Uncharacterized protein n=1 Tax=Dactylellina haptotyla (strain CBS 200.50) TaxID=1284197 RepID=S8BVY2_DACHA|nr:hypothetical protein H072_6766 [Dactylellina haptotyla CBS 200.50]
MNCSQSASNLINIDGNSTAINETSFSNNTKLHWVSQCNQRGTFDILWSCILTITLCTWTVLHLNLPAPSEGFWIIARRKAKWTTLTLLGPEFVLGIAVGQKGNAKRCLRCFQRLKVSAESWSLRHSFFANMGGFHIKFRDWDSFPITGRQICYLIENGHINLPQITEQDIKDKSKADGLAKLIVLIQVAWFVIQVVARAIQHLPITTIELTTIGLVIYTAATYMQWLKKPLDIDRPIILHAECTIEEIWEKWEKAPPGRNAVENWKYTPLDFIEKHSPSFINDVLPVLNQQRNPKDRPWQRIPNDRFPHMVGDFEIWCHFAVTLLYSAIHAIGWHFSFPTMVEMILWRVSSLLIVILNLAFVICESITTGRLAKVFNRAQREQRVLALATTLPPPQVDIPFSIPLWKILILALIGFIYTGARIYILVEMFVGLRLLPVKAYLNVEWTDFIPHF